MMQSWRNIDVVTGVMKDRCLREKFACLSLAENVHKKNNFTTTNSLKLVADTMLGSIDFRTSGRYNVGEYRLQN